MREVIIAAALAMAVALPSAADAAPKKKREPLPLGQRAQTKPVYDDNSRWYPNDANQLKFGSRIWWDQMVREGRIGKPDTQ
jgi:hypothetical protein